MRISINDSQDMNMATNKSKLKPDGAPADVPEIAAVAPATQSAWPSPAPKVKDKDKGKGKKNGKKREGSIAKAAPEGETQAGKMSDKAYAKEMKKLHVELVKLQQWVVAKGLKVCIVFEGRDGAGKGGTIKAITERVSPRVFRVIALPAPSEREKSQMYGQRYLPHLPAAGEVVIFDRSWYNRAGVERVMGFCTEEQARGFLTTVPLFESLMIKSGIILLKYWLEVSPEEQTRRLASRIHDGRKIWKLSPMDLKSYDRWDDYTKARDEMFAATDTDAHPWYVARSEDKKRVRLNVISHLLKHVPYKELPGEKIELPKRKISRVKASEHPIRYVPERF
jgi:polyphosphate kinase 2